MNEQLVVKNFGPIKEATVDFKRVTVFIGPTGGGKSTLAKLAASLRSSEFQDSTSRMELIANYGMRSYADDDSRINWETPYYSNSFSGSFLNSRISTKGIYDDEESAKILALLERAITEEKKVLQERVALRNAFLDKRSNMSGEEKQKFRESFSEKQYETALLRERTMELSVSYKGFFLHPIPNYFPSERIYVSSISNAWAGMLRYNIGLPPYLLDFANKFLPARQVVKGLNIDFLNISYEHFDGLDVVTTNNTNRVYNLTETASGIQSVIPLLVLVEALSINNNSVQSFIIEEPELNLFPTAQFELVKILVDKCARIEGKNDLVLTTHSPYVLTALNLMCYAFRIAQQDEATAKKVAKLIPRHCWIDPEQFAAYYVDRPDTKRKQQVRSIINKKTGLIEENELDTASEELSNIFDKLLDLRQPVKSTARAK